MTATDAPIPAEATAAMAPSRDDVIVRRSKRGPYGGPASISYVSEANDAGYVLGLTDKRGQAARLTRTQAEAILAQNNGKKNSGEYTIEFA